MDSFISTPAPYIRRQERDQTESTELAEMNTCFIREVSLSRQASTASASSIKSFANYFMNNATEMSSEQVVQEVLKYCEKKKPTKQVPLKPPRNPNKNLNSTRRREVEKYKEFSENLSQQLQKRQNKPHGHGVSTGFSSVNSQDDDMLDKTLTPAPSIKRSLATEFEQCEQDSYELELELETQNRHIYVNTIPKADMDQGQIPMEAMPVVPIIIRISCPRKPPTDQSDQSSPAHVSVTTSNGRFPVIHKPYNQASSNVDSNNNNNNNNKVEGPRITFKLSGSIEWHM